MEKNLKPITTALLVDHRVVIFRNTGAQKDCDIEFRGPGETTKFKKI